MSLFGYILISTGLIIIAIGLLGLFKFQGYYDKLHATGLIDCFGIPISLLGLICLQDNLTNIFKIIIMIILLLVLSPASTHALASVSNGVSDG